MTPSDVRALSLHEYGAFRDYQHKYLKAQRRSYDEGVTRARA